MPNKNPGPLLTPPSESWVALPAHVVEKGECIYCHEKVEDRSFQTYKEYLTNWWTHEYEGEPDHIPMDPDEWVYIQVSCFAIDEED